MSIAYFETKRKMYRMREGLERLEEVDTNQFFELFDIVWVYHDNALEGDVFTPGELRAALTDQVVTVTDSSSTTVMRDIRNYKKAIEFIRREAENRSPMPLLQLTKHLHELLTPEPGDRPGKYRRSGQTQRVYFHEIEDANRISYLLRKVLNWAASDEALREHPIEVACRVHYEFVHIYPFEKNSGRVGRLLLNYLLMREGFAPAVIHAQDRQPYYEALKSESLSLLTELVHESIENSIDSAMRRLRGEIARPAAGVELR